VKGKFYCNITELKPAEVRGTKQLDEKRPRSQRKSWRRKKVTNSSRTANVTLAELAEWGGGGGECCRF